MGGSGRRTETDTGREKSRSEAAKRGGASTKIDVIFWQLDTVDVLWDVLLGVSIFGELFQMMTFWQTTIKGSWPEWQ